MTRDGPDTTLREFESGGFDTRVYKRSPWITIRGRGGHLMMSVDEVGDVIAVLGCARDYVRDQGDAAPSPSPAESSTAGSSA